MELEIAITGVIFAFLSLGWQFYTWTQDRRRRIIIVQQGDRMTNTVFSVKNDHTAFVAQIAVINNSPRSALVIRGFELELLWNDPDFGWLNDPEESERDSYYIPGTDGLTFPREMILNHRTYKEGGLQPGQTIQGLLLGYGGAPIPEDFNHLDFLTMKLSVLDQDGKQHSEKIHFQIDKGIAHVLQDVPISDTENHRNRN